MQSTDTASYNTLDSGVLQNSVLVMQSLVTKSFAKSNTSAIRNRNQQNYEH